MKKRKMAKQFLSLFLACILFLNAPLSAMAFEDVQIWDTEEELLLQEEAEEIPVTAGTQESSQTQTEEILEEATVDEEGLLEDPQIMEEAGNDLGAEARISSYQVTIQPVNAGGEAVVGASVTVTYEEEDEWMDTVTETLLPKEDGSYSMYSWNEYTIRVTADGYADAEVTMSPSGDAAVYTYPVTLKAPANPADQAKADAVKSRFEKEITALRPANGTDQNIAEVVLKKLQSYSDLDMEGVTVKLKSSSNTDTVQEDGTIVYRTGALNVYGNNSTNVSCSFVIGYQTAEAETASKTVTVGWDRTYVNGKIQEDADGLTAESIQTENEGLDLSAVEADFLLKQCMGTSLRQVWSVIEWSSSDETVLSFEDTGYGSKIDAKKAVIHPQEQDKKVTLTAVFRVNDTILNSYVEKTSDFTEATKTFQVTVKGSGAAAPTEKELLDLLEQYYVPQLKEYGTEKPVDTANCQSDIQLPRYTKIKDSEGNFVFVNKEITVTSDHAAVKVNGYRAAVDIFQDAPVTANLLVTFTRDNVTVTKTIPITVGVITPAMLEAELEMMEIAKAHYFDGINDKQYTDAEHITGNLHAFQEMTLDVSGNPVWVYTVDEKTGKGIIPDNFFEDSTEMEQAGYNRFCSSVPSVVQHENLVVITPETDTEVKISSLLSSERYGKFAPSHPENEQLQKLYKQKVEATLLVKGKGTDTPGEDPEKVSEAQVTIASVIDTTSGSPDLIVKQKITAQEAVRAGYTKPEATKDQVTVLDALVVLHREMFGAEDFDLAPTDYLQINASGWITKIFGTETSGTAFFVNHTMPADSCDKCLLKNGDQICVMLYGDTTGYSDQYLYLEHTAEAEIKAGEEISLTAKTVVYSGNQAAAGCTVKLTAPDKSEQTQVTDKNGTVTFQTSKSGTYLAEITAAPYTYYATDGALAIEVAEGEAVSGTVITSADDFPTEIPAGTTYTLANDITLKSGQQIANLAGVLDGRGHVITLTDVPMANVVSGTIQNLGVTGSVQTKVSAGSMAVTVEGGTIRNSYSTASVSGGEWSELGGIAGVMKQATVKNVFYLGTITPDYSFIDYGGLTGYATTGNNTFANCYYKAGKLAAVGTSGSGYQAQNCASKEAADFASGVVDSLLNSGMDLTGFIFATQQGGAHPVLTAGTPAPEVLDWKVLDQAIEAAEALNESDYTEASWSAAAEKLNQAKDLRKQTETTQQAINAAAEALNQAVASLVKAAVLTPVALPEDESKIIKITSQEDFNTYVDSFSNKDKYFVLQNDIVIDSNYSANYGFAYFTPFSAVLDGQGHSITFQDATTSLFGRLETGGVVQNVMLKGTIQAAQGTQTAPLGTKIAGSVLNCSTSVAGTGVSGLAVKLSGGAIVNCFSAGTMTGGALVSTKESGTVLHTYYLDTLTSAVGTSMKESEMKTLTFVETLNTNKGTCGVSWGQSSDGYPYFGKNQNYQPTAPDSPYPELPGDSRYQAVFQPYNSTEWQKLGEDSRLLVSPQQTDGFKVCGTLALTGYEKPEGAALLWSVSSQKPSEAFAINEDTGEFFVYRDGSAVVSAVQKNADGSTEVLAYIAVAAKSQKIVDMKLYLGDTEIQNGACTVQGSEEKRILVKAKFEGSEDYQETASGSFWYRVSDTDLVFSYSESSSSFYFKKPGTAQITVTAKQNAEVMQTITVTSEYVPVTSIAFGLQDTYLIHSRNANSDGQESDGRIAFNPIHDGVIVTPANASNADKVTISGNNDTVAYYSSGAKVFVPKEAGTVTFTAVIEDTKPDQSVQRIEGSKQVSFVYQNPVTAVSLQEKEVTVACEEKTDLHVTAEGAKSAEGWNVTEPALSWSYDKEGIAKINTVVKGGYKRNTEDPDNNSYLPAVEYQVVGLAEGTVTATGVPLDRTNSVAPVTVKITVTSGSGTAPDLEQLAAEGIQGALDYLVSESANTYVYGDEWKIFALIRAGRTIPAAALESYYASVAAEVKNWNADRKPTDIERVALALTAMEKDITDVGGIDLAALIYNSKNLSNGANELIYALLALDAADCSIPKNARWSRDAMIAELLKYQDPASGGFGLFGTSYVSVDATAMALQALANDQKNAAVKTAVEKGLAYLKASMGEDYGFGSAESSAQVLLALSALGIDPSSEKAGFGTEKFNVITCLQEKYRTSEGAYSHLEGGKANQMATLQVLEALDAYQKSLKGSSYWMLNGIRMEVTFTLLGDNVHDSASAEHKIHNLTNQNLQVWAAKAVYRMKADTTVLDLLDQVLKENGMTYELRDGNYVPYITRNGVKLGEFTNGKFSGWMYQLNGAYSDFGVAEQKLKAGDDVVFYYTDDYRQITHRWDAGTVTKKAGCTSTGVKTYRCSCGVEKTETIPAAGHKYGKWTVVSKATVSKAEVQKHTCSVCKKTETKNVGKALTPVLELPGKLTSLSIKKGKTVKFTVTMAKGDSIRSVKADKTKYLSASVDKKTGKITLKAKKTGTVKLTITLASKKVRTYTVKVTGGTVKTNRLTVTNVTNSKLTLNKGKTYTLKYELQPFTSTQKVTYKSSNKKVATVTSAGKIKAAAPGKTTITATSGNQKVKITVTVPGISGLKTSVTVKKNKTLILKPALFGISGKVSYTSSNPKIATVDASGKIKGIKKGSTKITVKAGGFSKTVKVKVK